MTALETNPAPLDQIRAWVNPSRCSLPVRLAVAGDRREDLQAALQATATGQTHRAAHVGSGTKAPTIAFLFSGQGSQFPGMGHALYSTAPDYMRFLRMILNKGTLDLQIGVVVV